MVDQEEIGVEKALLCFLLAHGRGRNEHKNHGMNDYKKPSQYL